MLINCCIHLQCIIELVDSVCRDGTDMPISLNEREIPFIQMYINTKYITSEYRMKYR